MAKAQPITIPTQLVTAEKPRWKGASTPAGLRPRTKSKVPCPTARKACPVQLVFRDGKANLRLCREKKKPGRLVPVENPQDAMTKAKQLCACWESSGRSWDTCGVDQYELGDAPRSLPRSRGSRTRRK